MQLQITPAMMSVNSFCAWAGIGRTKTYEEIASRRLAAIKIGRRTLIPTAAAEAWLASHPALVAPEDVK